MTAMGRPLRILHISDRLSERGGADWHMLSILHHLAHDHDLHLAVGRNDGTATASCPVSLVDNLDSRDHAAVSLDAVAERFEPDLVHLHNVVNPMVLDWARHRTSLMTVQDHRCFCPGQGKVTAQGTVCRKPMQADVCHTCFDSADYYQTIYSTTSQRLDAIGGLTLVVLSEFMKGELVAAGIDPHLIHVIPPFVWGLDSGAAPSRAPCVLFAGRLVQAKGVWDAVEAWRLSGLELPLVFAGTGSQRNLLESAGFEILGWLDHSQLSGIYRSAKALVFPPRWQEPFGIAGLEALSMGTPVAAWNSGGTQEWHPGGNLLVEWGDVAALAGALRRACATDVELPPGFAQEGLMTALRQLYRCLVQEGGTTAFDQPETF